MLRTEPVRVPTHTKTPRVGAGTRSQRSGAPIQRSRSAQGDAVEIQEKRFGYFPQRFQWRGKSHTVQAVEQCWTKAGRSPQLCFRVRCQDGTFELNQHVKRNIWTLSVVQLT